MMMSYFWDVCLIKKKCDLALLYWRTWVEAAFIVPLDGFLSFICTVAISRKKYPFVFCELNLSYTRTQIFPSISV